MGDLDLSLGDVREGLEACEVLVDELEAGRGRSWGLCLGWLGRSPGWRRSLDVVEEVDEF